MKFEEIMEKFNTRDEDSRKSYVKVVKKLIDTMERAQHWWIQSAIESCQSPADSYGWPLHRVLFKKVDDEDDKWSVTFYTDPDRKTFFELGTIQSSVNTINMYVTAVEISGLFPETDMVQVTLCVKEHDPFTGKSDLALIYMLNKMLGECQIQYVPDNMSRKIEITFRASRVELFGLPTQF